MRRKTIIAKVALSCLLFWSCSRERLHEREHLEAIEKFWAIAGDSVVYLQLSLNFDFLQESNPDRIRPFIYRADSSSLDFEKIYENSYDTRKYWGFVDSTIQNSMQYSYYIYVEFEWGIPVLISFDITDTLEAFPYAGAPNPIPGSPESLSVVAEGDSFLMSWIPPDNCDSLYYLLRSDDGEDYYHQWYPHYFEPIRLVTPQYYFDNRKDSQMRYYKVIALVDTILSAPSEPDSVRHE